MATKTLETIDGDDYQTMEEPDMPTLAAPKHVMIDLETLGKRAGCRILSIGAVEFSALGLGRELYCVLSENGQESLHVDDSTLAWWERQTTEARAVLEEYRKSDVSLREGLQRLDEFVQPKTCVWGNGADFDNALLYAAYAAIGEDPPWKFWDSLCFRTLKYMVPHVQARPRTGAHNALADARWQAEHAVRILQLAHSAGVAL